MMIDCRKASELISQGADRRLPLWPRAHLRLHLLICDACTNFSRQVEFLRRAVTRLR